MYDAPTPLWNVIHAIILVIAISRIGQILTFEAASTVAPFGTGRPDTATLPPVSSSVATADGYAAAAMLAAAGVRAENGCGAWRGAESARWSV